MIEGNGQGARQSLECQTDKGFTQKCPGVVALACRTRVLSAPKRLARTLLRKSYDNLENAAMGLIPAIAKRVPEKLRYFCEGLRYPHAFIFSLPLFVLGLLFSPYIPYAERVLTVIGVAMFFFSKARWN